MAVPSSLGKAVVTTTYNWMQMVVTEWGDQWAARDISYRFSNGTEKQSTDTTNQGIYNGGAH